ncbi:HNH endonuclease [Burkholderia pseudomallei]|uniref:HNH endonuclease n=1 Tax=Burkholderia pseudomallei TaxID=28450 RepID=UPI0021F776C1|nr:HNH endonuclease [Burkholderia pseudomallei]MCW0032043.1 HNH endonuclease [Burkholderia pseudomallei]MCW0088635.1 HNH endonuclease [Burkholderia pseudomallei]MCW0102566.1 HNH endonuclease [Burkholderia pseudomallei]MCW0109249.1 HNH endonuclease [Burkholderia pseudomallei]MDY7760151.1 HNH endonuclease [Burkholderia pseudomallei]
MTEIWKPIPEWPEYGVSNEGRVRLSIDGYRKKAGHVLKPWLNRDRLQVELRRVGERKKYFVHQLVVLAFLGSAPTVDHEIAHWEGNTQNNRLGNLRYATPIENAADKHRHGRTVRGEAVHTAKLRESDIPLIRAAMAKGLSQRAVAAAFGVSKHAIYLIGSGKTWKHVGDIQ